MSNAEISITYTLSKAGQQAQALAGEDASRNRVLQVPHGDSAFAELLPHAHLGNDGSGDITCRNQYGKTIGPSKPMCDLDAPPTPAGAAKLIVAWRVKCEADAKAREEAEEAGKAKHESEEAAEAARLLACYPTPEDWIIKDKDGKLTVRHETGVMRDAYKLPEIVAMQKQARDIIYSRHVAESEAEEAEEAVWIAAHGSDRLKACLAEEIEYGAIYNDERLARERPEWVYYDDTKYRYDVPRNPTIEAFELLSKAREIAPDAKLIYYRSNDGCYAATEEWSGGTIMLFADDTYDD